jgi:hypothetical protein
MAQWSDNKHFTTKRHYLDILAQIGAMRRDVESPMMYRQDLDINCTDMIASQWLCNIDGPYLEHLDGRNSDTYRIL